MVEKGTAFEFGSIDFFWSNGLLSTPKQKCIGWPEQKYISDAGKKAPELGVFSLEVKPGWDYPRARPSWRGANGACSD